jgi:hypothetical protein
MLLRETMSLYEDKAPKAMGILEAGFYDAAAALSLPEKYRKRLRTTNSIEMKKFGDKNGSCVFPKQGICYSFARRVTHGAR